MDPSVFFLSIGELNAKLKAREFSCAELTKAFSDRLEKLGPRLNALALPLREDALRQARKVDDDLKRERYRGSLQGIPFGAKDLLAYAGHPTTWGARPYAAQVFDRNAGVINRLLKTGAVLTGKLSMVELAGGGGYRYAAASLTGPGLNPWDMTRWSGGSSSGSGSAVAAGLVTFALGSETSGSIITPSAYCGVTGLRPTYGLVSRAGAMALSWTMDKIGPMCRSAEDCGLVLQVISGRDIDDPSSAGRSYHYFPQYARKMADLRMGYAPADFDESAHESCRPVLREALKVFQEIGLQWKEVSLPDLPYGAATSTIISAEGSAVFEELIESGKVDDLADIKQIAGLKAGIEIPAREYFRAMKVRSLVQAAFRQIFVDVDLLLTPSRMNIASGIKDPLDGGRRPAVGKPGRGLRELIPAGNLAGLPALSLPCGFVDGLPVGIALVTRSFNENTILAVAREFQNRTDWHRRNPKL